MTQKKNSLIQLGMAAVVVSSLALSACKEETASVSGADTAVLKERLVSAEEEASALKKELEEIKNEAKEQRKEAEAAKKENENALVELQKKLREAKKTNDELQEEFDAYQEEYKVSIRQNAKGMELGTMTLSSGTKYTGVVVSKWTPAALRVTHAGGNATIPFDDLPETVQTVFLYDKEETSELLAKGEEAVSTGKKRQRNPRTLATAEPWPTKDPNGNSSSPGFTGPENTGIVNTSTSTRFDAQIDQYTAIINKGEAQLKALDKQVSEAIARGSDGGQRSLERKMEKIVKELQIQRSKRAKLMDARQKMDLRSSS